MHRYRFLLFLFLLILIGSLLAPFGLLQPVRDITYRIFSPVTVTFQRSGQRSIGFFQTFTSLKSVLKKNEQLENENLELKSQIAKLKEAEHESKLLQDELNSSQNTNLELTPARIIARSPNGLLDTLIIDKGSKDNLKNNQAVISHGYLIGRLTKVNQHTSQVLLITSSSSKIPAVLQESRGNGLLQGGLKGLRLEEIQLDIPVKKNETIVSSNLGQILPNGIPIGTVKELTSSEADISQSASVSSPIAFSRLEMVFVVH